jgi:hypothetical protein
LSHLGHSKNCLYGVESLSWVEPSVDDGYGSSIDDDDDDDDDDDNDGVG